MPATPFHLGWFTNFTADEWNGTFANGGSPWDGKFYVEMAQALERACFDYIIFEDKLAVPETYGGSAEVYLKHGLGMAPKHDPVPLATLIGASTSHLGVVATMSTLSYPPFLLARLCSTVDHICGGRFGWNIVTSAENASAQNFGLDELPPRELRYDMADEYLDLVNQLFASWEPDAVIVDRETSTYADFKKSVPSTSTASILSLVGRSTRPPLRKVALPMFRRAAPPKAAISQRSTQIRSSLSVRGWQE